MPPQKITKKQVIAELIRCGKDPVYFIKTYGKISHPVRGLVPFQLYPFQEDIIRGYTQNRFNIILKARQLGVTTVTGAYIAWFMVMHRHKNVIVIATKQEAAKNTIRVIRNILKNLPKWFGSIAPIKVDNRHSIELENGSRVKAITTSADAGRSEAVSLLFIDEVAHIDNMEELWTGLFPVISTGGCAVLASTPKGTGNFFHRTFVQAQNKENLFNCHFGRYVNPRDPNEVVTDNFPWWVHPERDDVWFKAETAGKPPRDVAQEYECSFNASGDTFVHHEDIGKLERMVVEPNKFFAIDRNVWLWDDPQKNGTYLIAADISRGDAKDYSAFHVLRLDTHPLEQVAEYKGKIKPDQLGVLLMAVSQFYNNAIIAPENNSGWSGQTILKLEEANYPFIYYSRRNRTKEKTVGMADPYYAAGRNDFLPGYTVTSANRLQMLAKLEQYVRLGDVKLRSSRLIDELKTFVITESGKPDALRGYNDDLIMALAGALWVREEAFMFSYRSDEMTKAMLNGMSKSNTSLDNFKDMNYINPNNIYKNDKMKSMYTKAIPYESLDQKTLENNNLDISWLFKG